MAFDHGRKDHDKRLRAGRRITGSDTKFVAPDDTGRLLEAVIRKGDRVCLEGDNQKQAKFLAEQLAAVDSRQVHDLHLVQSSVVLDEHVELFRRGIADRLDFAYAGPQAKQLYDAAAAKQVKIGAIHTYLELYARYLMDLAPKVSLVVAEACDLEGNLFTGFNTEDTPMICEATHFRSGIVIAEVKEQRTNLPRTDIPHDWVDFIVVTGEDAYVQPLFTRNPAHITDMQILMAMMTIKGIYHEYGVRSLNHGIGYPTAAIELLLPTFGRKLHMKGKHCTHWVLNPHPTLIPAIEKGFVERIYSFGGEPGMEEYVSARSDIFTVGPDGHLRSNRALAHMAGLYAVDLFVGATFQIDMFGNSSTAIEGRIAGFGGAPNLGSSPPGRRHVTDAVRKAGSIRNSVFYGRKLVVQVTPTISEKAGIPVFVEELDAVRLCEQGLFDAPPVMITDEQVTHIVTEVGIAYLDRCPDLRTRIKAIAAVAGDTSVGRSISKSEVKRLREAGIVRTPEDLGIKRKDATRKLLAAQNLYDLVKISGDRYHPPASVR